MRRRGIKQTALCLALFSLFSTGWMAIRAEGHFLHHGESGDHAARHAAPVCAWMCAASTFIDSAGKDPAERFYPSFETPVIPSGSLHRLADLFSFHIRPPPFS